jgi:RNA polymerase sigma-70 factor, ECF subfamily
VLANFPSRDRHHDPANKTLAAGVSAPFDGEAPAVDPDQADLARFLDGDAAGFETLMTRYRQQAYGIALGLCGNHDDAMDAVQKAFIRLHRSLPRFRLGQPFFPWFYRIVRNAALNQRRDERRHRGDVPLEWVDRPSSGPTPLEAAEAEQLKARLWEGIQRLSPELREVFVLYHFQGLKYREIAAAVDVPLGTVMSRLHAARQQLRRSLGEEASS